MTDCEDNAQNWKDIVQKRIESKTRRFAHGRSKPEAEQVMNRFAPVAGYFFYPLMKNFDRSVPTEYTTYPAIKDKLDHTLMHHDNIYAV